MMLIAVFFLRRVPSTWWATITFNNMLRPGTLLCSSSTADWTFTNAPIIPLTINYERKFFLNMTEYDAIHSYGVLSCFWIKSILLYADSKLYLLGQFCWLQLTLSVGSPLQTPPYFSRTDFVLVLSIVPPPQVKEQTPLAHSLHSQLTKINQNV